MQQLENDLDQTQEKLMNANQRLEEKEKALQNVSLTCFLFCFRSLRRRLLRIRCNSWHTHRIPYLFRCFLPQNVTCGQKWQAKEEVEALEKKMQQLENELAQTQTNLEQATTNLEEKEKALQNVSFGFLSS